MSGPRRLLDDESGASTLERDLLCSGRDADLDPPPSAKGEVWAALLARLPPGGGPSAGGGPGATGGAAGGAASAAVKAATGAAAASSAGSGSAALAKAAGGTVAAKVAAASGAAGAAAGTGILNAVLIGAGSALVVIATYTVATPSARDPAPIAVTAPLPERASSPFAPAPRPAPGGALDPAADPAPAATADPGAGGERAADPRPAPSVTSRLQQESQLLGQARDALRRGDAPGALVLLEKVRRDFPGGRLTQEREALSIEALFRSGQRAAARDRAAAFLATYPTSPLVTRVAPFAQ